MPQPQKMEDANVTRISTAIVAPITLWTTGGNHKGNKNSHHDDVNIHSGRNRKIERTPADISQPNTCLKKSSIDAHPWSRQGTFSLAYSMVWHWGMLHEPRLVKSEKTIIPALRSVLTVLSCCKDYHCLLTAGLDQEALVWVLKIGMLLGCSRELDRKALNMGKSKCLGFTELQSFVRHQSHHSFGALTRRLWQVSEIVVLAQEQC